MITKQDAWEIIKRFRDSVVWDERNTVYELVKVIEYMMTEQEKVYKK